MREAVVAVVFIATIAGLYLRPFGAKDWQIALIGAALAWAISPLSLDAGLHELRHTWNIEAFFLGLMLLGAGAETAGLYARAAELLKRRHPGRGRVATVLASGTVITTILSNDATPLILTPAIFASGVAVSEATTAAAFAATLTADGASLLLPISNPVGLLFYERFNLAFGDWLVQILPAALAAIVALGTVIWWRTKPVSAESAAACPAAAASATVTQANGLERAALVLFVALAIAYVAAAVGGVPLGLVTLGGGLTLLVAILAARHDLASYRRSVTPGLLIFVGALLLLVECVSAAGALHGLSNVFDRLAGQPALVAIVGAALAGIVLSNLMNNWPAAVVLAALVAGEPGKHMALVAGALIGCTVGANLTVVGSLSTVFWLSLTKQAGVNYSADEYARRAWLPTLAAVIAACLVASITLR